MNYNKIQEILQSDSKFAPLVANRDTKVTIRGGECLYAALTVRVAQEMAARGIDDKGFQKTLILAFAATLSNGIVPPKASPPAVVPVPPRAQPPPEKREANEKVERVVVKPSTNPAVVSPAKQAAKQQQDKLDKFVERGDILKYQSAVAMCQLLASLFQLAENDTWPGNDKRKALLNELLESYEEQSKQHVNLSVKQILRAQIESQI